MRVVPVVAVAVPLETEVGADARIEEIDGRPGREFRISCRAGAIEQGVATTAVLAPEDPLARPLIVFDESGRRLGGVLRLPGCPGRTTPVAGGKDKDHHGEEDGAPGGRRSISRPAQEENPCAGAPGCATRGPQATPRPGRASRAGRRCCRRAPAQHPAMRRRRCRTWRTGRRTWRGQRVRPRRQHPGRRRVLTGVGVASSI